MTQSMKEYIGIREATNEEIAAYNKVEALDYDVVDTIFELMCEEAIDDLVRDTIRGTVLLSILSQYGITVEEACQWYFTEVD